MPTLIENRPAVRKRPVVRFDPLLAETPVISPRTRKLVITISIVFHVLVVATLMILPATRRTVLADPPVQLEIVFAAPTPRIRETIPLPAPTPKPEAPKPKPRPEPKLAPPPVAKPVEPPPPPPPVVAKVEPPPPPAPAPPPKPAVRTGLLEGAAAGPVAKARAGPPVVTGATGFESVSSGDGGTSRERRTVATAGFGDGSGAPQSPARPRTNATVASAGFEAQSNAGAPRRKAPAEVATDPDTDVEILSKPKPAYTDEARRLRIEGDVVLQVTFGAGGTAVVLRVVEGLGYGLDEAAIDAAKKIRFNPAKRDGRPVDHTANLRVVFRLA